MSTFGQRLPSEPTTIGDTEEYKSLQALVDKLGKRDFSPQGKHEHMWASIFSMHINQIPFHIPSGRSVSPHERTSFMSTTKELLLVLQFIEESSSDVFEILRVASSEVKDFNGGMIRLLGQPAFNGAEHATKPTKSSPGRKSFYQFLYNRSSKLFNSLIRHLQPCTNKNDKHRAMLHLTQHRFSAEEAEERNDKNGQGFCMLLASCPDRKTWQHTQWAFSEQGYLIDPQVYQSIHNLCSHAQKVYDEGECLAIEVTESSFLDVSVTLLGQRPPPPSTAPTKSLLELCRKFPPNHKTVLACALAYSLLCLHEESTGPWLQQFWTLRSIFFLQESTGDMVYDIHHPYISCELAEVSAPSDIKQVFDQACDHGSVFIQAFGKLLLELARGGEAKTLLGSQIVNIPNLMDLNREVVPEHPGGSYREVVNACLVFPKTLRGEQKAWEEAQKRAPRQTPDVPVSAQDLIFRQIVEPLRKAVDDLGSEAWRPANLDLKAGAIRLDALASSVSPCLTASAMGVTKVEATGPHLLSVQSPSEQQKDTANITRSPDTPDQVAISPSIHLGFGTCLAFPKTNDSESSKIIEHLQDTIKNRFQRWETDKPIRIAVLDTGIDEEYAKNKTEKLEKPPWTQVVARSNFCVPEEKEPDVNTHDLDGHGTNVASIILNLAQNIELYIARVCRGSNVEEADRNKEMEFEEPEPAVVARAVHWAVENEVDVINLSLGYRDEQDHPGISDLHSALKGAAEKRILVFAATSNEGLTADVAWPAKNLIYAIGIHSSTDNGQPSNFNGKASDEANLMVVGERILSCGRRGELQLCNGTSFATPVAAAIGAMILAFVRQEACKEQVQNLERAHSYWDWKALLRTNRGMRNVLKRISEAVPDRGSTYYRISKKLLWEDFHLEDGREHALNIIVGALKR